MDHPVAIVLLLGLLCVTSSGQVAGNDSSGLVPDGGRTPSRLAVTEDDWGAGDFLMREVERISDAHILGEARPLDRVDQEGFERLPVTLREQPGDLETNFALGRAAFEAGDYETAVMAFERILMARPGLRRVKLELARSYFRLGLFDVARRYFDDVLATEVPENVRENIEVYLQEIDRLSGKQVLSGMLSLGCGWDSNVHANCDEGEVETITGERILLPKDRDTFINAALVLQHKFRLLEEKDLWWKSSLGVYRDAHAHEASEDTTYVALLTGPAIETPHWVLEAQALLAYVEKGGDPYAIFYGGALGAARELNDFTVLVACLTAQERNFHQDPDKTGLNVSGSIGPAFLWGKNRLLSQVGLEHNYARAAWESYDDVNALIRYERDVPWGMTLWAGYRFDCFNYKGTDVRFGKRRRDLVHEASVGLAKELRKGLWAELGYAHTSSGSSVQMYDYDRDRAWLGFRLMF